MTAAAGSRRAAVLGHPVSHSLSPALHRAAYAHLGLDWTYDAIDVEPPALAAFLDGLDADWVGLSLTMPLKETVLPLLTSVDDEAARIRSVNTVLLTMDESGRTRRHGTNTDVPGLVAVLAEAGLPAGAPATVLGGGATARSALAALARRGATRATVCVRRPAAGDALVALGRTLGLEVSWLPFDRASEGLSASVVVSTLPPGTADQLAEVLSRPLGCLVDVVYAPWPTPLATTWSASGGPVVGGLELLVHQAVEQVRLMTGRDVPAEVLRAAGERALAGGG